MKIIRINHKQLIWDASVTIHTHHGGLARWIKWRAHSPTFTVTLPTSQLILQPFRRFTYVTAHSQTLPLLHLRHSSFSNLFASPTSQALHLIHMASRPWQTNTHTHTHTHCHLNYVVILCKFLDSLELLSGMKRKHGASRIPVPDQNLQHTIT